MVNEDRVGVREASDVSISIQKPEPRDLKLAASFILITAVAVALSRLLVDVAWYRLVSTIAEFSYAFAVGPFVLLRLMATALQMLLHTTRAQTTFVSEWLLPTLDTAVVFTLGLVAVVLGGGLLMAGTLHLLALA